MGDGTTAYPARWESDVVLADGGTVHLRPVRQDDDDRLLGLYSRLSDESLYLRFFSPVPRPDASRLEELKSVDYDRNFALVAELGGDIVAVARYMRGHGDEAEVAFTVQDDQQGRGLGTVLLEYLAAIAREHGISRFVAMTLSQNTRMLRVFAEAGFEVHREFDGGTVDLSFDIEPTAASVDAEHAREHTSEARSVARLLAPTSVAVIGASRRRGTIGNGIMRNLLEGDFRGPVYPVNPNVEYVAGVHAYPTVMAIPGDVDLGIVCVPAEHVRGVVEDCVAKRVHGLVIISAGFAEIDTEHREAERQLVEIARRNGIRLIGPNCMGVVNTSPDVSMNGTFAPVVPAPGRVGFASQSGGLGIELLARSGELGLGLSTFVSMGNKADVSGNDLLQYWEEDPDTDVILLYLESFGNPGKFARLARRIARHKPIIAVKSGRTVAGARGTSSHTAALASPDVAVDALFHQAGVIRVDTLEELFDTASIVLHQPLPSGRRVAVVSNGGGPGILAADACEAAGLEVPELTPDTQAKLRAFVSPDAGVRNPVDLVASAPAEVYGSALTTLLTSGEVDALLVIFVPPLVIGAADVATAVTQAAAAAGDTPVISCFLGRNGTLDLLPAAEGSAAGVARRVPTFAFPESAAAALGRAVRLAEWRARPEGVAPVLAGADVDAARRMVGERLAKQPDGEWLGSEDARDLLTAVGAPIAATVWAGTADDAARAAERLGYPVAVKVGSSAIVHKTEVGGVQLDLSTADAVRRAFDEMHERLGDEMGGAIVQRMIPPGVEMIVGVTRDASFGSLVLLGLGGVQAELMRDTALRIVPLTDRDAHELVRSLRGSPLLFGYRNTPQVDVAALEDLVLRVGLLAEHVPEIAELDCNPVIVSPDGATVADLKVRLAPVGPTPPGVRRLRDA
jgi:acetyl coenzyme A synthetase (ADP forming)-like protein